MSALTNPLLLVIMVGVLVVGIWYGIRSLGRASNYDNTRADLATRGIETHAKIVDKRSVVRRGSGRNSSGGSTKYYITYRYTVSGKGNSGPHTTEAEITHDDYESLDSSSGLQVRYLPDQPTTVQIWSGASERQNGDYLRRLGWVSIGGACSFVIILLIWFSLPSNTPTRGASANGGTPAPVFSLTVPTPDAALVAAQSTAYAKSIETTEAKLLNSGTP